MATLPSDFNSIFGSAATGGLTPIPPVDYVKGWEYVGANPPTKNDFSYLQNTSDQKAKWLYDYLVLTANAASRKVGEAAGNIPDISYFGSSLGSAGALNASGFIRLPGGYIRQWGTAVANSSGDVTITFPIAFAVKPDFVGFGYRQASAPDSIQSVIINDPASDNTKAVCRAYKIDGTGVITGSTSAFYWSAEGRV